jgi:membrane associated rhomboid family serine protease
MGDRDYFHHDFDVGRRASALWASHRGTKIAIALLAGIHLAMALVRWISVDAYVAVYDQLALSPEGLLSGKLWQLVTYALLHDHGTIWHILINCLVLWWFGSMVETRMTTKRFAYFCLSAAVVGGLAHVAWGLATGVASSVVGASGVTMALLVLGACWYPTAQILLFFVLPMPLWLAASIFVALDLLGALGSMTSNVAYAAHLGGAAWGFLFFRFGNRIEGVFRRIDRMAEKAERSKQRKRESRDQDLRAEVDRILDKVNREGMTALTDEERRFLKNASKKLSG